MISCVLQDPCSAGSLSQGYNAMSCSPKSKKYWSVITDVWRPWPSSPRCWHIVVILLILIVLNCEHMALWCRLQWLHEIVTVPMCETLKCNFKLSQYTSLFLVIWWWSCNSIITFNAQNIPTLSRIQRDYFLYSIIPFNSPHIPI